MNVSDPAAPPGSDRLFVFRPASVEGTYFPGREGPALTGTSTVTLLSDAPHLELSYRQSRRRTVWTVDMSIPAAPGPGPTYFREEFTSLDLAVDAILGCYFGGRIDFDNPSLAALRPPPWPTREGVCLLPTCVCARHLAPPRTPEEVRVRCDFSWRILGSCELVESEDVRQLERCRVCRRHWVREYPFGDGQRGGPTCAYHVPAAELPAENLTATILEEAEEIALFDALGPDVGPGLCRAPACGRLSIWNGVLCARHHYESLRGRPAPAAGER